MRRLMLRAGLILGITALAGMLSIAPALAQGYYPSGGSMSGGGGMTYQAPARAPAPAAGPSYSTAPSAHSSSGVSYAPGTSFGASVRYVVRAGDTLSRIAARFGTSAHLLLVANPGIMNANRIFIGQTLFIPFRFIGNGRDADDLHTAFYRVNFGDTLARIARRFGVSQAAILRANPGIFNPNLIFAGQTLAIPQGSTGYAAASGSGSATGAYGSAGSSSAYAAPPAMPPMAMPPAAAPGPQPAPTQAPMVPSGTAPAPTTAPAAQAATVNLTAHNLAFNMSTITVPAGAQVVVNFNNQDAGVPHNFAVYNSSAAQQVIFRGQLVTGTGTTTYTFTAPSQPGTYFFRCDVHPTMMNGQFVVH